MTSRVSSQGFLACGSRGEARNTPELGNRFVGASESLSQREQGMDRITRSDQADTYSWINVALTAEDQLRQRVGVLTLASD